MNIKKNKFIIFWSSRAHFFSKKERNSVIKIIDRADKLTQGVFG